MLAVRKSRAVRYRARALRQRDAFHNSRAGIFHRGGILCSFYFSRVLRCTYTEYSIARTYVYRGTPWRDRYSKTNQENYSVYSARGKKNLILHSVLCLRCILIRVALFIRILRTFAGLKRPVVDLARSAGILVRVGIKCR